MYSTDTSFLTVMPTYLNQLDNLKVLRKLEFRFKKVPIVYGIRCSVTGKVDIGSSLVGHDRIYQHFISHVTNVNLQAAITKHGLSKFTFYVFVQLSFPANQSYRERQSAILKIEQLYIDKRHNSITQRIVVYRRTNTLDLYTHGHI